LIKLIPNGISTKNFYDHKEVGCFLQDKKLLKHCKNRNILKFVTIAKINSIYGLIIKFINKIEKENLGIKKPTQSRFFESIVEL